MVSVRHTEDQQVPIERTGFLSNSPLTDVIAKKTILQAMRQQKLQILLRQKNKLVQSQAESTCKMVAASQKFAGDWFVVKLRLSLRQTEDHHTTKQLVPLNAVNALFS